MTEGNSQWGLDKKINKMVAIAMVGWTFVQWLRSWCNRYKQKFKGSHSLLNVLKETNKNNT